MITAEDGEDAISKFIDGRDAVQLVILDVIMPRKSGTEATEEIRKLSQDAKILFSSGYTADKTIRQRALGEGTDFIMKPLSPKGPAVEGTGDAR